MKDDTPFILECPGCHTRYEIPVSIPEGGRKVRCASCFHIWVAQPGDEFRLGEPEPFVDAGDEQDIVFRDQAGAAGENVETTFGEAAAPEAEPEPQGSMSADMRPDAFAAALAEAEGEAADGDSDARPPDDENFADSDAAPDADFEPDVTAAAAADGETGVRDAAHADLFGDGDEAGTPAETGVRDEVEVFYGDPARAEDPPGAEAAAAPDRIVIGKAKRRPAVAGRVAAGWLGLLAAVAGLGALAVSQRVDVVRMMPGTAWVFEAIGMPVNVRGLDFRDVAHSWETDAGQVVLEVHGDIVNITSGDLAVPSLVLALRDETEKEVYQWEEAVMSEPLGAGDSATFAIRIPTPPKSIKSVQVRFARAR